MGQPPKTFDLPTCVQLTLIRVDIHHFCDEALEQPR